jgi:hypothetical protein
MQIKANITLCANGKSYPPGSILELADDEAERAIFRGFAEKENNAAVPNASAAQNQSAPEKPAPAMEDIVDAIASLDPTKDFGKNGKPNVEAIVNLLDATITAAQRDEAWDIFRQGQSENSGDV